MSIFRVCIDVVGVVTRGPCRKDFGINHEEKKFVIFIVDQSSRFEVIINFLKKLGSCLIFWFVASHRDVAKCQ